MQQTHQQKQNCDLVDKIYKVVFFCLNFANFTKKAQRIAKFATPALKRPQRWHLFGNNKQSIFSCVCDNNDGSNLPTSKQRNAQYHVGTLVI